MKINVKRFYVFNAKYRFSRSSHHVARIRSVPVPAAQQSVDATARIAARGDGAHIHHSRFAGLHRDDVVAGRRR